MHIHNVFFWLKEGLDPESSKLFEEGLASLTKIPEVASGSFGKPAETERPVIDNTYDYGLILIFESIADHDQYQDGVIHLEFLAKHAAKWGKVQVYDIETL
ncbi:MAG: Dabb family protein [Deltaproteobacteria bacterium]|jgi:hypothetical protein|nr:Dabb family protein [Deltaproteobacteria bacterium]MBT6613735.1 Dabb family protein [Deltaproteobacteria bacterium]MBT7715770.1 Dabb family protein [Deltaproteobacteria bacterium]